MAISFGEQLRQLALSMDVIDDHLLDEFTGLMEHYLAMTLDIQNAKVMIADQVDGEVGLLRHSLKGLQSEIAIHLKLEDGSVYGQSALAFVKGKPLWIVSAEGEQNLQSCDSYIDLWSGLKKIPRFKSMGGPEQAAKTRIVVPIKIRTTNRIFGLIVLESSNHLHITKAAQKELQILADTLSIAIRSHKITNAQQRRTDEAIASLENVLKKPLPTLTKPNLFLAFGEQADKDVTALIVKILKTEYKERVNLINWQDMDQPGNINQQLIEAISACRYAVCYLSEKDASDEFADNRNVIFEAGMFHGRREETSAVPTRWLPVREKDSPNPPFDFAQERILLVERNKNGDLKQKVFAKDFRDRVEAMLTPPDN